MVLGGRYEVRSLIGRGGMAEVWEAWDRRLERTVALKILHPVLAADPAARLRFEAEARSAGRLSHPNIVSVYDTGEDSGRPWMVMERLQGQTLATRIAEGGPIEVAEVARIGVEVASALEAAHGAGIVHRDVKPANILFAEGGVAKVADFGIAKAADAAADSSLTATNAVLGTPAYLAPERAQGGSASAASDIWSLGVVLYEALAARKAFAGSNPLEVALAAREPPKLALRAARPDAPAALVAAIERAMAVDPAQRFGSAGEFAAALRAAVRGEPDPTLVVPLGAAGAAAARSGDTSVLPRWVAPQAGGTAISSRRQSRIRRRRKRLFAAALFVGGLLAIVALSLLGGSNRGPAGTTSTTLAPSATLAPSTTAAPSTTLAPTTTSTAAATIPPGAGAGGAGKGHAHHGDH